MAVSTRSCSCESKMRRFRCTMPAALLETLAKLLMHAIRDSVQIGLKINSALITSKSFCHHTIW
eukprot:IDg8985t1